MSSVVPRSQIQKQVLSLYKECLRAAEVKNRQFKSVVRSDFKRNAKAIQRSDTMRIEYLVRQGQRRLEMMKDPHVSGFGQFVEDNVKDSK